MKKRILHEMPISKPAHGLRSVVLLLFSLTLIVDLSFAQIPPDRDVLLNGEGAGQGAYAEFHGYPGPKHVLDLAKELQLKEDQKKNVQAIYDEMATRAKELGQHIVQIEEELDGAFRQGLVVEKSVRDDSEEIGRLRGRLKSIHLIAHMKTRKVLTDAQVLLYKKLRQEPKKQKH